MVILNKAAKFLSFSLLSFAFAFSAFAIDIDVGGQVTVSGGAAGNIWHAYDDNYEGYTGYLDLLMNGKCKNWIDVPLRKDGSMGLGAQVSQEFEFINNKDTGIYLDATVDVDLLRFYYNAKSGDGEGFSFSAGRFNIADKTGIVVNQACDGLSFGYSTPRLVLGLYAGYTGLLNSKTNLIINSEGRNYWSTNLDEDFYKYVKNKYDESGASDVQEFLGTSEFRNLFFKSLPKMMYKWADGYYVSKASLTFPNLFCNQTIHLDGSMFLSLNGPSKTSADNRYNRFYWTLGLSGPFISPSFTYAISTTFHTSSFVHLANMTVANLNYYTDFHSLVFGLNGLFASGENNSSLDAFHGFTSRAVSYKRYGPEHTGVIKGGFSVSFKPIKTFYVSLGADRLYSYNNDRVVYDGWQSYGVFKVQCTSDFQAAVKFYRYYAARSVFDNAGATVTCTLNF